MKTPSGRIHVGSLRGVIVHDLVHKALRNTGVDSTFTYVFEDQDPMDDLPQYLDANEWKKYLGQPLFSIPSPDGKAESYGHYFAYEFKEVFNKVGANPDILWTSDLYRSGRMNDGIRTCLDQVRTLREIYNEFYEKKLDDTWYPFQVLCPQCGKQSTTRVIHWDGNEVTFECKADAVAWTQGCGYRGKTSPFSNQGEYKGKLSWKVEWPLKWKVIGVTIEGAGKDHMSAGGSHDVAKRICERVLHYPVPYPVPYEFFLIGGKKMSSSKGRGSSAKEVSDIIPPYLLRFVFTRTDLSQAINFDPVGTMEIPDLFDEYDRCWKAFLTDSDEVLSRAFELAQIDTIPEKKNVFIARFRDVVNYVQQPSVDINKKFAEIKGSPLTPEEDKLVTERALYARIWLGKYAPEEYRLHMSEKLPEGVKTLTQEQRKFLERIIPLVETIDTPEELQVAMFNLVKEQHITASDAFKGIYISCIGKEHGPRAAWFLLQYPKDQVIQRLREAVTHDDSAVSRTDTVRTVVKPEYIAIDKEVREAYPSISVGIALIKNVTITDAHPELEKEKISLLHVLQGLTTEQLGKYPEIISYRRLYKEMGIDWHSRRPSPEALLRRVALGKELYTVNTCVDAYNLIVMKYRVSIGAFDSDKVEFPAVLRFAGEGDEIILLGDSEPTKYKSKEIAYYDKAGGYNIDFNFRDAQRTQVTSDTKNLWINVDGVYDITPGQVHQSLHEAVQSIVKYCGGTVEFEGVV